MALCVSTSIDAAILQAVAYADVFDYPLTSAQVHRYLVGMPAPLSEVQSILCNGRLVPHRLEQRQGYFFLPGRNHVVETRWRRAEVAARMWPRARRYGEAIARLPFVRMVAVTGALAVDNVEPNTDIDYFIVTEPGRLWLCRALTVGLVHLAARRGDVICPNYFLSDRSLTLDEPTLFTAHELAQMVPLWGLATYHRMCQLNPWAVHFLPNAFGGARPGEITGDLSHVAPRAGVPGVWGFSRRLAEVALRTPAGSCLERWEMGRKVRKLGAQARAAADRDATMGTREVEAAFSADRCKGHFDRHGRRTLSAFGERMQALAAALPRVAEAAEAVERETAGWPA